MITADCCRRSRGSVSDCHRLQAELKAVDLLNNVSFRSAKVRTDRIPHLRQFAAPARKWPLQMAFINSHTAAAKSFSSGQASRFGRAGCAFDRQRHHLAAFSMCGEVCSFACGELPPTNAAIGDSQFLHRFAGQGTQKRKASGPPIGAATSVAAVSRRDLATASSTAP